MHDLSIAVKVFTAYYLRVFFFLAKNVLSKYNISDIEVIELDEMANSDQIQDYLLKLTGARTVS